MPEDIAGGSYVPDMPVDTNDDMGDFIQWLEAQRSEPSGPPPKPILPEERGPGGVGWERSPHDPYLDPPDVPPWVKADPNYRQQPIENRSRQGLEMNYMPQIKQSPESAAILKVLELRNAGQDKGFDEEGYERMPIEASPMAVAAGMNDLRNPKFTMDPARDRYLGMVQVADRLGIQGSLRDNRVIPTKTPTAEEMVAAAFDANKPDVPIPATPVQRVPGSPGGKTLSEQIEELAMPMEDGTLPGIIIDENASDY